MSQHKPVRLFSFKSILILCFVSLVSLVLLFPSRSKLLALVEDSSTADISLAFLKELYSNETDSADKTDISLSMAKNYLKKAEYTQAIEILETLINEGAHNDDDAIVQVYIAALLEQNNEQDGLLKPKIVEQLNRFTPQNGQALAPEVASYLAKTAIAQGYPDIALQLLAPHADLDGIAAYKDLIPLALQSENFYDAISYASLLFAVEENFENARRLLDLLLSVNSKVQIQNFLGNYEGYLSSSPKFLNMAVVYAEKTGSLALAQTLVDKLIAIEADAQTYNTASRIAQNRGELALAAKYLEKALEIDPQAEGYIRLNQLYRWMGNILLAQRSSVKGVQLDPSETAIRNGIEESKALDDLGNAGMLYAKLSERNFVTQQDYDAWLDAIEKGQGFDKATKSLLSLLSKRPDDTALLSHNARLSSYTNSHQLVVNTLLKIQQLRPLSYEEVLRGANALIMLDKPSEALKLMKKGPRWQDANEEYIEMLAALAFDNSDRELAIQTQQQLKSMGSDAFSRYQYIRLLSPLNQENAEKLLPIYESSQDNELLFTLLSYASEVNNTSLLNQLLEPTLHRSEYNKEANMLMWQAKYFEINNNMSAAKDKYLKMFALDPNNELAISNLIWFALEQDDKEYLNNTYQDVKAKSLSNPNLWLAMASASEALGLDDEALAWYRKLLLADSVLFANTNQASTESLVSQKTSPSVLLNYASLLARSGNNRHAYAIRKHLFAHKSAQLLALPEGDISYRSLVGMFLSPSLAKKMTRNAAILKPSQTNFEALLSQNLADQQAYKILFWQQQKAFANFKMPDWQQLSMAILQKDVKQINHLLDNSSLLSMPDKYIAYMKTGRHNEAWQLGEKQLGSTNNDAQQQALRALHAQLHPIKTHSTHVQSAFLSPWDVNKFTLEYLSPHEFGNWRVSTYKQDIALENTNLRSLDPHEVGIGASYFYQQANSTWQLKLDFADGVGNTRFGVLGEYSKTINDYFSANVHAGVNLPNQFSRLMYIAGKENRLGVDLAYRPTARESLFLNTSYRTLSTRFGDDVGEGWGVNLRFNEQLFFNDPAFQVYANLNIQKYSLNDAPLTAFNRNFNTQLLNRRPYNSLDFAQTDFRRFSIGQRLENGLTGIAGRTKPSPTYWLDTSVGYNQISQDIDIAISSGLGLPIFGDDELYLKVDWQSADFNGEETLFLSLGYIYGL